MIGKKYFSGWSDDAGKAANEALRQCLFNLILEWNHSGAFRLLAESHAVT